MESQNKRLLKYLQEGNKINPLKAWEILGIYRLSARIFDLAEQGNFISSNFIEVYNRFGEKTRVKEYYLKDA